METIKGYVIFVFVAFAAGALSSSVRAGDTVCPGGYYSDFNNEVCISLDFSRRAVTLPGPDHTCMRGFEKPPGVNYCLARHIRLSMNERQLILTPLPTDYCPENFSRPPGSTICTADNLVLDIDTSINVLTLGEAPDICEIDPRACQSPPSVGVHMLELECPWGFLKPPGAHFCMSETLIINPKPPADLPIPGIACPESWHRQSNSRFCTPVHTVAVCDDSNCMVENGSLLKVAVAPVDCPDGTFARFGAVPQVNQSDQSINNLTTIPVWFCSPPSAGVHLNPFN